MYFIFIILLLICTPVYAVDKVSDHEYSKPVTFDVTDIKNKILADKELNSEDAKRITTLENNIDSRNQEIIQLTLDLQDAAGKGVTGASAAIQPLGP